MSQDDKKYYWKYLLPAAILMLACCAYPRFDWVYFFNKFHTYPSDIWYIYDNYGWFLKHQAFFNMEYPAPMFILFKVLFKCAAMLPGVTEAKHGGTIFVFRNWIIVNSIFLGACGLGAIWYTHALNCRFFHLKHSKVLWGLVLTPAFFFFSIYNYDLVTLLCCTAALYSYLDDDYLGASAWSGLGFAFKIYPGVMFPLFWLLMPKSRRWKALGAFLVPWVIMNVPYMLYNIDKWLYPYTWQMQFDNTEQNGRLIYHLTQCLGKVPALALLSALMGVFIWKAWKRRPADCATNALWLARCSVILIISFIMLKNVFSPQYLLWIAPFLALIGGYPFFGLYTLVELLSGMEVSMLYYWRDNYPQVVTTCIACRDIALISVWVYVMHYLLRQETQPAEELPSPGRNQ